MAEQRDLQSEEDALFTGGNPVRGYTPKKQGNDKEPDEGPPGRSGTSSSSASPDPKRS